MSDRRKPPHQSPGKPPHLVGVKSSDSFQNFAARTGIGTGNLSDGNSYGFHPVSRNRVQLEFAYRGSWMMGMAVDCVAEDMTREGVEIRSTDAPDKLQALDKEAARLQIQKQLCSGIKYSRLYGGAIVFMMIDGQDTSTPLRLETLRKGQFKGLLPLDRWVVNPSLQNLVSEFGPQYGKPQWYDTLPDTGGMPRMRIHHSRVIRIEGVELPYWQRISENLWGQSVLERLWDRVTAFDSATQGTAQLVYKAHLRTYSIEGFRDVISAGGPALDGLLKQLDMTRRFQSNEGMTLMDAKDKFEAHQYAFGGLSDVLTQFGQQISGALQIPLVRLFGQSPAGMNSTGESDLRTYYDNVRQQQQSRLGPGMETLYRVLYISKFGTEPPTSFEIDFKPLWQTSATDKAQIANTATAAINTAYESQIIDRVTALQELKQLSRVTGVFTNVTAAQIAQAVEEPAPSPESLGLVKPDSEGEPAAPRTGDGARNLRLV